MTYWTPRTTPSTRFQFSYRRRSSTTTDSSSGGHHTAESISQHNDAAISYKRIILNPPKALSKVNGGYTMMDTFERNYLVTTLGTQQYFTMKPMFTRYQLSGYTVTPAPKVGGAGTGIGLAPELYGSWDWSVCPWDMNPMQKITGSYYIPGGDPRTLTGAAQLNSTNPGYQFDVDDYIYIHNAEVFIQITNFETCPQIIDFHLLQAKKNGKSFQLAGFDDPYTKWSQGLQGTAYNQLSTVAGDPNLAASISGAVIPETYGAEPFYEKLFNEWYKLLYKKHCILQPGDTKFLNIKVAVNKMINRKYLRTLDSGVDILGKLTLFPMIMAKSVPVKGTAGGTGGSTGVHVTTGPIDVGVTQHMKIDFKYPDSSKRFKVENANSILLSASTSAPAAIQVNASTILDTDLKADVTLG